MSHSIEVPGYVVRSYRIHGTPTLVIEAWETGATYTGIHSVITRDNERGLLGAVNSRRSDKVASLRGGSPERIEAAAAHHAAIEAEALAAIEMAFPGLAGTEGVRVRNGSLETDLAVTA